ncbi:Tat pathway signal protein [Pandoraea capi]|uniref:Tat pathway signal protein n=1 Tax=Pandoraea capi TaxID=2508286 RepID=A0ABY6W548_9BURK|nr:DUF4434 domain-containing protein [Pandoraea capi]VVE27504.1 Tat pathway signal protein [Pandoraea capi]
MSALPDSPMRRRLLRAAALATCLPLVACDTRMGIGGTFLQLWREHLDWGGEQWRARIAMTRALGCQEIFVQWIALSGNTANEWQASPAFLTRLLDECHAQGIGVHLGVPYDERWWSVLGSTDASVLDSYMRDAYERAAVALRNAALSRHPAFRGWYLPYELEQYSWSDPARLDKLAAWLGTLSKLSHDTCGRAPTISTFYSHIPGPGGLQEMWRTLLDRVDVYPMVQDGVGEWGIENYAVLAPLRTLFVSRGTKFDLILELFQSAPDGKKDGVDFKAHAASFSRIQKQWDIASEYGAQRVIAFAIDPWVLGDTPQAHALLRHWQSSMR